MHNFGDAVSSTGDCAQGNIFDIEAYWWSKNLMVVNKVLSLIFLKSFIVQILLKERVKKETIEIHLI